MCQFDVSSKKMTQAVSLLTCTWEVPGSNVDRETTFSESFRSFAQFIQAGTGIVP